MDHLNDDFFQVSVKGMFFDESGKLMMILEKDGLWELPGGRIQKSEDLIDCLKRECMEEIGLECEVLEAQPTYVWSAIDDVDRGRIMVCYKIKLNSLEFVPTDECQEIRFFTKEEIKSLELPPQLSKLPDFL